MAVYLGSNLVNAVGGTMGSEEFVGTLASGITRGNCFGVYDKTSNIVYLTFHFYHTADIQSSQTIFTIPEKYRPSSIVNGAAFYSTSSSPNAYTCSLNASGQVYQTLGNTIRSGAGTIIYILD